MRQYWVFFVKDFKERKWWFFGFIFAILAFNIWSIFFDNVGKKILLNIFLISAIFVYVFIQGINLVRTEWRENTVEFLLSLPVKKYKWLLSKFAFVGFVSFILSSLWYLLFTVYALRDFLNYHQIHLKTSFSFWIFWWLYLVFSCKFSGFLGLFIQTISSIFKRFGKLIGFLSFASLVFIFFYFLRVLDLNIVFNVSFYSKKVINCFITSCSWWVILYIVVFMLIFSFLLFYLFEKFAEL